MELQSYEEKVDAAIEMMFAREEVYGEYLMDSIDKEHEHKMLRAKTVEATAGTIKDKETAAEIACEQLAKSRSKAEALTSFAKEKLLDARAALSARQSILNAQTKRNI